jgi:hypothetical protein
VKTVRSNYRRNVVPLFALATIILCVVVFGGEIRAVKADNNHSEQIVFSGVGLGTFSTDHGQVQSPFGFWVWCQNSNSSGKGVYGVDKACFGGMYIYGLGITEGVFGFGENGGVTEGPDGIYTMDVHSADGKIHAHLKNASPDITSGPSNEVDATFLTPAGSGASTNAVVIVTGKE